MSPFYPIKAKEKGVTVVWVGIVIGTMAVFQIISSFLVGRYLNELGGRNTVIFMATIMIILQALILGSLEYVEDDQTFLWWSFIAQIFGGMGAGANSTSSMAILSSFSQDEREKYIGIVEASFGVGLLFGPLIGAFFYKLGGYVMPFVFFGKFIFTSFLHQFTL
jgi:MFS family permease